jgi:two-component system NarL family sensor kinase
MICNLNNNYVRPIMIVLAFVFIPVYCCLAQDVKTLSTAKVLYEKDSVKQKDTLSNAQIISLVNQSLQKKRRNVLIMSFILISFACLIVYLRVKDGQKIKSLNLQLSKQKKAALLLLDHEQNNRLAVAKAIHDQVGQTLSVAKMSLSSLVDQTQKENHLNKGIKLIDKAVDELRKISRQLVPEGSSFGLIAALDEYVYQTQKEGSVKIEVQSLAEQLVIEKTRELIIFDTIQGILAYRIGHAEATAIKIKLSQGEKEVIIEINDNGLNMPQEDNRMDMEKTRTRMVLLGAELSTSNQLMGNQLQVTFPKHDGSN